MAVYDAVAARHIVASRVIVAPENLSLHVSAEKKKKIYTVAIVIAPFFCELGVEPAASAQSRG